MFRIRKPNPLRTLKSNGTIHHVFLFPNTQEHTNSFRNNEWTIIGHAIKYDGKNKTIRIKPVAIKYFDKYYILYKKKQCLIYFMPRSMEPLNSYEEVDVENMNESSKVFKISQAGGVKNISKFFVEICLLQHPYNAESNNKINSVHLLYKFIKDGISLIKIKYRNTDTMPVNFVSENKKNTSEFLMFPKKTGLFTTVNSFYVQKKSWLKDTILNINTIYDYASYLISMDGTTAPNITESSRVGDAVQLSINVHNAAEAFKKKKKIGPATKGPIYLPSSELSQYDEMTRAAHTPLTSPGIYREYPNAAHTSAAHTSAAHIPLTSPGIYRESHNAYSMPAPFASGVFAETTMDGGCKNQYYKFKLLNL